MDAKLFKLLALYRQCKTSHSTTPIAKPPNKKYATTGPSHPADIPIPMSDRAGDSAANEIAMTAAIVTRADTLSDP
jgi:hypothetical protein